MASIAEDFKVQIDGKVGYGQTVIEKLNISSVIVSNISVAINFTDGSYLYIHNRATDLKVDAYGP